MSRACEGGVGGRGCGVGGVRQGDQVDVVRHQELRALLRVGGSGQAPQPPTQPPNHPTHLLHEIGQRLDRREAVVEDGVPGVDVARDEAGGGVDLAAGAASVGRVQSEMLTQTAKDLTGEQC
jgi:hypothetical protein